MMPIKTHKVFSASRHHTFVIQYSFTFGVIFSVDPKKNGYVTIITIHIPLFALSFFNITGLLDDEEEKTKTIDPLE